MPQVSTVYSIPAPVGGLNTRDALANMPETDAVLLDNWFPQPTWVESRGGSSSFATFTGDCRTIMAYNGVSASKLFAAVKNGSTYSIFNATAGGALSTAAVGGVSNTVQALTSADFDYAQMGTSAAEVLMCANGADPVLTYDGTNWAAASFTGLTPGSSSIKVLAVYKNRMWLVPKNSLSVWYTGVGTYQGAVTEFPLAGLFKLGGYIQSVATISIDNAGGLNDYIAFISSQGEVIVYQGYDPSSASTWTLTAHFRIGRPLAVGRRCWTKVGSDVLLISTDGFIMLSEALLTDRSQNKNAVSDKIRKSVTDDSSSYGSNFGWQALLYPLGNKLLINVPVSATQSYQYVMNTLSGAWCTFGKYSSPWNAYCWEVQLDTLYYGTTGVLYQADTGTLDGTSAIIVDARQAYSYFGTTGALKQWTMARPVLGAPGPVTMGLALNTDFATDAAVVDAPLNTGVFATWNTSPWNTTYWTNSNQVQRAWQSISGVGYAGALRLRATIKQFKLNWQSTDFVLQKGGVLG